LRLMQLDEPIVRQPADMSPMIIFSVVRNKT
ncbi:MAG: hypothetical protein ACI9UJ_001471, partial [bacterium]